MQDLLLFPFLEYWWAYAAFVVLIITVLAFDLGVFSRKAHEVTLREAAVRSVVFVTMALAFNAGLYYYMLHSFPLRPDLAGLDHAKLATDTSLEFLAGYVVEYALAVDNVFVFVAVFAYFAVPIQYQQKVLFYGILGAIAFRALFISLGAVLMQYHWVIVVFGIFLIGTGIKILFLPEKPMEPEKNPAIRLIRRLVPVTPDYHGEKFWVTIDTKVWATPLFVALAFIELSDIVFAIMGLRSLFFVLQSMVKAFEFLKYGLGAILAVSILVSIGYNRSRGDATLYEKG